MDTIKINTPLDGGFFNCLDGGNDRTYTAENFTGYLSSIICDGILDTWGDCFSLSYSGTVLTVGTGYAWIGGHYAILSSVQKIDLAPYADAGLSRVLAVGISCDTAPLVRACSFEVMQGLAGSSDKPVFESTDTKKVLTLCYVKMSAGGAIESVEDTREDTALCGWVKCILGKCGVTDLIDRVAALEKAVKSINDTLDVIGTPAVIATGKCGDTATYTMYANGCLQISGSGAVYDQNAASIWAKEGITDAATKIVVDDGITSLGSNFFMGLVNVQDVLLSDTVTRIGSHAFSGCGKITSLALPAALATIESNAFSGTKIAEMLLPASIKQLQIYAFFGTQLTDLHYASTKAKWQLVDKVSVEDTPSLGDAWDTISDTDGVYTFLSKVTCTDGSLTRNADGTWQ